MANLPKKVRMVEVGPRDGLQNEAGAVPTATRIALIDKLADTGLKTIESGSFVSPKWIPKMADTAEVMAGIHRKPGVSYPVLVPNIKGFEGALASHCDEIAVFAAASETFSRRNTNCSIAESIERFAPVAAAARENNIRMRGYVSIVVDCPYEGPVAPQAVADVAAKLHDMGCYEISLGDTIGTATPGRLQKMIETVAKLVPPAKLAGHYHDTYGQALANVLASLELGVATFDSSVAGLGGCPYAPGATGNVASEDVLYMLDGLGIETGVDLAKLAAAGQFISKALGREPASKVARALAAKAALKGK
jgi:hydroxymethylglutaryl-CoA lyase